MKSILHAVTLSVVPALAWAQVPAGGEFRVNTYTSNTQQSPAIAVGPRGDFVVAWWGTGQDDTVGVFAQRHDAAGSPLGGEFRVNLTTTGNQSLPAIVRMSNDGFVVVWMSDGQDGSGWAVVGRAFAHDGTALGGEFVVNQYTTGQQTFPAIAAQPNGEFVVAWQGDLQDGYQYGIFARRFRGNGAALGNEFQVNTYTTRMQLRPSVDADQAGNFVVVWDSDRQDGSLVGVFARRFEASGLPVGAEFRINEFTLGNQFDPAVAFDASGRFVVAWSDYGIDGDDHAVRARRFDSTGTPLAGEFGVNTYTTGRQWETAISASPLGDVVVIWSSVDQDGGGSGVFGRRFRDTGAGGPEFRINSFTNLTQAGGAIGTDDVGNFVASWWSDAQDGSGLGVFAQRFGGLRPVALRVDTQANGVFEPGEIKDFRPTWQNINGVAQTFTGTLGAPGGPPNGAPGAPDFFNDYGTLPNGVSAEANGYTLLIPAPSPRPVLHWDGTIVETIAPDGQGQRKQWLVHVGRSFEDVPPNSPFYRFVETLLHHGVTGGCSGTAYCPASSTTRAQMAVFVLVAKEGTGYVPPACTTPMFADVPASSSFCRWIEELARRGVVSGCGGGNYCPANPVTREQMAVFVLRTLEPTLNPPACVPPNFYNDVPETSPFCPWIEELTRRGVVTGCGTGIYCPTAPVTRQQMGVFISVTFGLTLYGP